MTAPKPAHIIDPEVVEVDRRAKVHIRRLLSDLRDSLSRVFSDSPEVNRVLHRIGAQGWSLYLVIDKSDSQTEPNAFQISSQMPSAESDPTFRINGRDLTILRSLGIDPTRTLRRRRRN